MSERHSQALRARWAKIPQKDRKKAMSALASKKQSMLSARQKRRHALKMVEAREQSFNK